MSAEDLEVISSNSFLCSGFAQNEYYYNSTKQVPVTIIIFKDGHTDVLCPSCNKNREFLCKAYRFPQKEICPYGIKRKI